MIDTNSPGSVGRLTAILTHVSLLQTAAVSAGRLSEELAMPNPSTGDYVRQLGFNEGQERGRREGACRQLRKLLLRLGRQRFGPPAADNAGLLDLADQRLALECLHELSARLSSATGWSAWTAAVTLPEQ